MLIKDKNLQNKMLNILTIPDEELTLRGKSQPLSHSEITSSEFKEFINNMKYTCENYKSPEGWTAAGLSGVQVDEQIQVFLAYDGNLQEFAIYINPVIDILGNKYEIGKEGCLSVPSFEGKVRRPNQIKVRYLDINGEKQKKKLSGWNARVVLHEYDHLQGILFIDKLVK